MLIRDWSWITDDMEQEGFCSEVTVDVGQHSRVSDLLGPDGEPLRVGYRKPKLGFDLTSRAQRPEKKKGRNRRLEGE